MIESDQEGPYDSNATSNENANIGIDVINIYSDSNVHHEIQSPKRPASLELRNTSFTHIPGSVMRSLVSHESASPWALKSNENSDYDKLLGQLGNNGSTTVTPTSFLNPNNITEDQESFADKFTKRLDKLKEEREGWVPNLATECPKVDPMVVGDLARYSDVQDDSDSQMPISPMHHMYDSEDGDRRIGLAQTNATCPYRRLKPLPTLTSVAKTLHRNANGCGLTVSSTTNSVQMYSNSDSPGVCSTHSGPILSNSSASSGSPPPGSIDQHTLSGISLHYTNPNLITNGAAINDVETGSLLTVLSSASNNPINTNIFVPAGHASNNIFTSLSNHSSGRLSPIVSTDVSSTNLLSEAPRVYGDMQLGCLVDSLPHLVHASLPLQDVRHFVSAASDVRMLQQLNPPVSHNNEHLTILPPSSALLASVASPNNQGLTGIGLSGLSNSITSNAISNSNLDTNPDGTLSQDNCSLSDSERQQHSLNQPYQSQLILTDGNGSTHLLVNTDGLSSDASQMGSGQFGLINTQVIQPTRPISLPPLNPRIISVQHITDQHSACSFSGPSPPVDSCGLSGSSAPLTSDTQHESLRPLQISLSNIEPSRRSQNSDSSKQSSKGGSVCGRSLGGRRRGAATAAAAAELMRQTNGMKPLPPLQACNTQVPTCGTGLLNGSSLPAAPSSFQSTVQQTTLPPPNIMLHGTSNLPSSPLGPTSVKKSRSVTGEGSGSGRGRANVSPNTDSSRTASLTGGRKKSPAISQSCIGSRTEAEDSCLEKSLELQGNEIDMLVRQDDNCGAHTIGSEMDELDGGSDVEDDNMSIPGFSDMPSSPSKQKQWKLEHKRARNRIAARRCRERKVSLIQSLEAKLAERDAEIRRLQAQLERYRMEGQHLMRSMEVLATTYPSLRDELPGLLRSIPEAVTICTASPSPLSAISVSVSMPPPTLPPLNHSALPVSIVQINPSTSAIRSCADSFMATVSSPSLASIRFPVNTLPPIATAIGTEMHLTSLSAFNNSGQGIAAYLKAE